MAKRKEKPEYLEGMVGSADLAKVRAKLKEIGAETLDDIPHRMGLAILLGVENKAIPIRKALVDRGLISKELPEGYNPIRGRRKSSYLDSEVVGGEAVMENLKRHITGSFNTLDDIPCKMLYSSLLGVDRNKTSIIKTIVDRRWMSSKISDYDENTQKKIIERIITPSPNFKTYYLDSSLDKEIWKENVKAVFEEIKRRDDIEHIDEINREMPSYCKLCTIIGLKKNEVSVVDIKAKLIELGLFSIKISDYDNIISVHSKGNKKITVSARIIDKILNPTSKFRPFYLDSSLDYWIWKDNAKVVFEELRRREGITHLNDFNRDIINYQGFLIFLGTKNNGKSYRINDAKTRFIHLGFFDEEVEKEYDYTIKKGSVVELMKKLDYMLFDYKDIFYDSRKVDMDSFGMFKEIYEEMKEDDEISNSLDLIESYYKIAEKNPEIIKRLFRDLSVECLDDITGKIVRKNPEMWHSFSSGSRNDSTPRSSEVKRELISLGVFSLRVDDYKNIISINSSDEEKITVYDRIIEKILHPPSKSRTDYLSNQINNKIQMNNIKVAFEELKKRENIEYLSDINKELIRDYVGFWNSIGARGKRKNDVQAPLIHLGFFNDEAEEKYAYAREEGSAVELMKKLDYELFDYKDILYDSRKVDIDSFKMLKALNEEAQKLSAKQRPRNSIDLFEYYHKEYAK